MNMKTYAEIGREARELSAAMRKAQAELEELLARDDWKETRARQTSLAQWLTLSQIRLHILQDNEANAMAEELRPALADVLKQYDGKPYGPKTAEKIREALKARTGLQVWLTWKQYGDYCLISARPVDCYHGDALELETIYAAGHGLGGDNRIHALDGDPLRLRWHRPYVADPEARAREILAAFDAVEEQVAKFDAAYKTLRDLLPSSMDCPYYARWNKTTLF